MSNEFLGKTVIISGGAGGIGFALAKEFGANGMNVVIADIDQEQLKQAEKALIADNKDVLACALDVTDFSQWQKVVSDTQARFGDVHMLINNAGVGGIPGRIEDTDHDAWRWVVDVNLMGVLYGTQAATPALKSHGEGGWIINVASMAGMNGIAYSSAYSATKAAVVSLSESWAVELKPFDIQVSALCPAFVKTLIHQSHRNMQDKYKADDQKPMDKNLEEMLKGPTALVEGGIPPELLAKRVVEAVESGQAYIFTHPNYRELVGARANLLDIAFADAENSPLVKHLKSEPIVSL